MDPVQILSEGSDDLSPPGFGWQSHCLGVESDPNRFSDPLSDTRRPFRNGPPDPCFTSPSQRCWCRIFGYQIPDTCLAETIPQHSFQAWRNRHESVSEPVGCPVGVMSQINVTSVEDPQLRQKIIVDIDPRQPVNITTGVISEHPSIPWVGLR